MQLPASTREPHQFTRGPPPSAPPPLPPSLSPSLLSNALYALAFVYYYYLTFLGYNGRRESRAFDGWVKITLLTCQSCTPCAAHLTPKKALPFLERTELFLYPIGGLALAVPLAILAGFNPTRFVMGIYFG